MQRSFYFLTGLAAFLLLTACGADKVSRQTQEALDNRLLQAIRQVDFKAVDSSLIMGASVDLVDPQGAPLIMIAAATGNKQLVQRLLQEGAVVDARRQGNFFSTPLMEVSATNDTSMARFLIEHGADVNKRDTFGDPPINWAAYYGYVSFVDLLVENGADWTIESSHGTAIDIAMKEWHDALVEYFIDKGAGIRISDKKGKELVQAVKDQQVRAVEEMLREGASADQKDELGTPVLVIAASRGNIELLELLIRQGADPDLQNRVGQTAMSRAAYFGHWPVVKSLIESGADVEAAGEKYHLTPLISAAMGGHPDIGRILIEKGAGIDSQDGLTGFTPLMYATAYGHEDFVRQLVDAGANPYIKGFDGTGLYDMLSFSNNDEISNILQDYVMKEE